MRRTSRWLGVALLAALAAGTVSCAYYNTFYLARKYYMKATDGQPYEVDRETSTQRVNYNKSADYCKKLLGVHPRSKWVDDAWLLWARTFMGVDDPLKAVAMLEEFETRFPNSDLKPDAEFFLGLAYEAARRHESAVDRFNNFIAQAPKHELVPYAWYERSKALISLERYAEAGESAGQILEHFPKHRLFDRALRQRAEARYQQRDWKGAREDFRVIGQRALNDDVRLRYLLREVDCLESSRSFDEARTLLRDARAHVPSPPAQTTVQRTGPTAQGSATPVVQPVTITPALERYGRITLRMGGVELLDGHVEEAVRLYQSVLDDYPRTSLAAEAQFRIGYAYETGADDFARARTEYQKVRTQAGTSQFTQQAQQRLENLDRIERFRTASGEDSLLRQAESRFLTAEHYLFNLDRPDRAVDEYRAIADSSTEKSVVARALNAQAWVWSRKLGQPARADSLFWRVVREYPGTEAQLAARDYLEGDGVMVPESLIVAPKEPVAPVLDADLTPPPDQTPRPGRTLRTEPGAVRFGAGVNAPSNPTPTVTGSRVGAVPDSVRRMLVLRDSLMAWSRRDTTMAGRARMDSLRRTLASSDTAGRARILAEIERSLPKPESVQVAPDGGTPPDLRAGAEGERIVLPSQPPLVRTPLPAERGVDRVLVAADSARARRARADSAAAARTGVRRDSSGATAAGAAADSGRIARPDTTRRVPRAARASADSTAVARTRPASPDAARRRIARPDTSHWAKLAPAARDSARRAWVRLDSIARADARRDSIRAAAREAFELRQRLRESDPLRLEAARRDSVRRARERADYERRLRRQADSLRRARAAADSAAGAR